MHEFAASVSGRRYQMFHHLAAIAFMAHGRTHGDLGQIAVFKHIPQITIGDDLTIADIDVEFT